MRAGLKPAPTGPSPQAPISSRGRVVRNFGGQCPPYRWGQEGDIYNMLTWLVKQSVESGQVPKWVFGCLSEELRLG